MTEPTTTDALARLREPFGPEHVGKLPKPIQKNSAKGKCKPQAEGGGAPAWQDYYCGGYHGLPAVHLDYVGHGAVTARLLSVDPLWDWEPMALDPRGLPLFDLDTNGNPIGLWIRLTVCGITRLGFGSVAAGAFEAEKQLIGDALRNAAMRFGVALDLWIKGQAEDDEKVASSDERERPARQSEPAPPSLISAENVDRMRQACAAEGVDVADVVAAATDNRTEDPAQLLTSEIGAARDALRRLASPTGEEPTPASARGGSVVEPAQDEADPVPAASSSSGKNGPKATEPA